MSGFRRCLLDDLTTTPLGVTYRKEPGDPVFFHCHETILVKNSVASQVVTRTRRLSHANLKSMSVSAYRRGRNEPGKPSEY